MKESFPGTSIETSLAWRVEIYYIRLMSLFKKDPTLDLLVKLSKEKVYSPQGKAFLDRQPWLTRSIPFIADTGAVSLHESGMIFIIAWCECPSSYFEGADEVLRAKSANHGIQWGHDELLTFRYFGVYRVASYVDIPVSAPPPEYEGCAADHTLHKWTSHLFQLPLNILSQFQAVIEAKHK